MVIEMPAVYLKSLRSVNLGLEFACQPPAAFGKGVLFYEREARGNHKQTIPGFDAGFQRDGRTSILKVMI